MALADLIIYPWAMPPQGTLIRTRLDAALLEQGGADIVPRVETTSLFTLQTLLSTTDYVGMCSEAVAHHMQTLGLLSVLQLTESISFAPIGAVWRADRADATTRKFVDALRLSLIAPPR